MKTIKHFLLISLSIAVIVCVGWFYFHFCFVFGSGVKAGQLNHVVYKGVVWKTYEGRLIQTGFRSDGKTKSIQSNEFNFSITDKSIADSLMKCSGKTVELHYNEYFGILPWRGNSKYVVDEIVSVSSGSNSGMEIIQMQ